MRLKILVCGYSDILRRKSLNILSRFGDVDLVTSSSAIDATVRKELGRVFSNLDFALSTEQNYDFVYLCGDPVSFEASLKSLKRYKVHTIVEKPLAYPGVAMLDVVKDWPVGVLLTETFQYQEGVRVSDLLDKALSPCKKLIISEFHIPKMTGYTGFREGLHPLYDVGRYSLHLLFKLTAGDLSPENVTVQSTENYGCVTYEFKQTTFIAHFGTNSSYRNEVSCFSSGQRTRYTRIYANHPTDSGAGIFTYSSTGEQSNFEEIQEDTFLNYFQRLFDLFIRDKTHFKLYAAEKYNETIGFMKFASNYYDQI